MVGWQRHQLHHSKRIAPSRRRLLGSGRPLRGGQNALSPQIAIDAAGDAAAVWEHSNGTNTIIQSASRPVGGAFSAPIDLSVAGQNALEPQIAIDAAGNAVAVWQRSDGTNGIIQTASTAKDTKTTVLCNPSTVISGANTTCTATVSDTAAGPSMPGGTVKFASNGAGAFANGGACTLSGAGKATCQISYTPSQVGSATHTITASYQGDGSRLKSEGSAQVKVLARPTPTRMPNTTLQGKPRRKTAQRRAVFHFVSDQPGSTFQCKLDRKAFKACHSPFKAKVEPGRHSFSVRAISPQGVADPTPAVFHWTVGRVRKRR